MKRLALAIWCSLVLAGAAFAGPPAPPPPSTGLRIFTVATLPPAETLANTIVVVIDANAVNDCSAGGGSTRSVCISNGSAWLTPVGSGLAEIQDEAFSAANFNGDATHAVSQDDFYDYVHIADTDDDGLPNKLDISTAGNVYSTAAGVVSSRAPPPICTLIKAADANADYFVHSPQRALTLTKIKVVAQGGTNVVGQFQECDANGANCADTQAADTTATAGTTATNASFTNASIDADDVILWKTTSVSGTNTQVLVCFEYTD